MAGTRGEYNGDTELTQLVDDHDGKEITSSLKEYEEFIIEEVENAVKYKSHDKKAKQKLQFYHHVRCGNTKVVKMVIKRLEREGMDEELSWLIGSKPPIAKPGVCLRTVHWMFFIFYSIVCLLVTPIFHSLHALLHWVYRRVRQRPILAIDLPFVFAVVSEKNDMIELFREYGCTVETTDRDGNNIYHYLADLSADKPSKAIRCHKMLTTHFEVKHIRHTLMTAHNYQCLTALEAIGKFGAIPFYHHLMESEGCIGRPKLTISDLHIWTCTPDVEYNIDMKELNTADEETTSNNRGVSAQVWEFDMTDSEQGDIFGKQSLPLQLIAGRSVTALQKSDADAIIGSRFLRKWMQSKTRLYAVPCIIAHLGSLSISVLLVGFLMANGGDMNLFPLAKQFYSSFFDHLYNKGDYNYAMDKSLNDMLQICGNGELEEYELLSKAVDTRDPDAVETGQSMVLLNVLSSLFVFQLVMEIMQKQLFLYRNFNFRAASISKAIVPLFYKWIPGSYAEKQLSGFVVVPYFVTVFMKHLQTAKHREFVSLFNNLVNQTLFDPDNEETFFLKNKAIYTINNIHQLGRQMSVILMVCMLLRFIQAIHSMRLLPAIGFFIITTKKMAGHLVEFGLVFTIVMLAFAAMFHLGMRNPDCPALKSEGYKTLGTSMYSTYQMALGAGDAEPFWQNINAIIAYIGCTTIVVILLLNLIIAVMTTTATELNISPWKEALCLVEFWDEILGTEAQVLSLIQPFRAIFTCSKCSKNRTCKNNKACSRLCKRYVYNIVYINGEDQSDEM